MFPYDTPEQDMINVRPTQKLQRRINMGNDLARRMVGTTEEGLQEGYQNIYENERRNRL